MHIIPNFLEPQVLSRLTAALTEAEFVDGQLTARGMARNVKKNVQLDNQAGAPMVAELTRLIQRHPTFAALSLPVRITPLRIARYTVGMEYGAHSDNAVINGVRTDLSFTLFLSDPKTYEGGELALQSSLGERRLKLPAGSLVLYETGAIHRVMPVTSGERLVAVGWVQSRIRDPLQRETVVDLEQMRAAYLKTHGHDAHADLLLKTSMNLQRMWSQL